MPASASACKIVAIQVGEDVAASKHGSGVLCERRVVWIECGRTVQTQKAAFQVSGKVFYYPIYRSVRTRKIHQNKIHGSPIGEVIGQILRKGFG